MLGPDVTIAEDVTPPFSNRTFEVLDGTWAPYRDAELSDFHLGLRLEQVPVLDVSCFGFFGLSDGQAISGSTAVRIWLRNEGNQPLTGFPISYRYGQGSIVTQTFNGTLVVGEQELVTFNNAFVPGGQGEAALCAWASLAGDMDMANDTACVDLVITVGVDERADTDLLLFPNPADGQVRLKGLGPGAWEARFIDMQGRTARSAQMVHGGGDLALDLDGMAAGGYQLVLDGQGSRHRLALVVLP
jgi:hypothetical protein